MQILLPTQARLFEASHEIEPRRIVDPRRALQEPDTEVLVTMLNAVEEIIGVVGPELLSAEQLAAAFERFKGVFAMSEERRQERALRRSQEDFDEEEAEALQVYLTPCSCSCS